MTERIFNVDAVAGSPLEFLRLVIDQQMPPLVSARQATNDYYFVYLPQSGILGNDDELQPAHSWICWNAKQSHRYGWNGEHWLHSCFHVRGSRVDQIFNALPMNKPARVANPAALEQQFHVLFEVISATDGPDPDCTASCLECIVRLCLQRTHSTGDSDMQRLWNYLQQHFNQAISLDALAEYMHCSSSSLRQRFKDSFGLTIIDRVTQLRMQEASYLLQQEHFSISDIASRVGYNDPAYFSRLIKKHLGASPRDIRQRSLKS